MSENGKYPDSELAEIPGGRLTKEAAANWLALRREGGEKLGDLIELHPDYLPEGLLRRRRRRRGRRAPPRRR